MQKRRTKTSTVFVGLVLFFGFFGAQSVVAQNPAPIQVGENIRAVVFDNQTREYLLYIPKGYDSKTPLPLILLFHGLGGTYRGVMELTDLRKMADEHTFLIAAPQGISNTWNPAAAKPGSVNDTEFIKTLINEIGLKVSLEKKRIYAMGWSMGARMCSRLGCDLSNTIAAIGGVAGIQAPAYYTPLRPQRPLPVISIYGSEDMYYDGERTALIWAQENGCSTTPVTKMASKVVELKTYVNCKNNAEVIFYRITGGGHVWPDSPITERLVNAGVWSKEKTNKDINATNLIWNFFEAHPMP